MTVCISTGHLQNVTSNVGVVSPMMGHRQLNALDGLPDTPLIPADSRESLQANIGHHSDSSQGACTGRVN